MTLVRHWQGKGRRPGSVCGLMICYIISGRSSGRIALDGILKIPDRSRNYISQTSRDVVPSGILRMPYSSPIELLKFWREGSALESHWVAVITVAFSLWVPTGTELPVSVNVVICHNQCDFYHCQESYKIVGYTEIQVTSDNPILSSREPWKLQRRPEPAKIQRRCCRHALKRAARLLHGRFQWVTYFLNHPTRSRTFGLTTDNPRARLTWWECVPKCVTPCH